MIIIGIAVTLIVVAIGGNKIHGFSNLAHHGRDNDGGAGIKREELIA